MSTTTRNLHVFLGICLFICCGCLVCSISASADQVGKPASSGPSLPRFNAFAKAMIESQKESKAREELADLFKEAMSEIQQLSGKSMTVAGGFDATANRKLSEKLEAIIDKKGGVGVVAALALDTSEDDYVRQAAWGLLMHHVGTIEDMPILCQLYENSIHATGPKELGQRRGWLEPKTFRFYLGNTIAYYCGIENTFESQKSMDLQNTQPKEWLISILQHGIAHESDKGKVAIISGCLLASY